MKIKKHLRKRWVGAEVIGQEPLLSWAADFCSCCCGPGQTLGLSLQGRVWHRCNQSRRAGPVSPQLPSLTCLSRTSSILPKEKVEGWLTKFRQA